MFQFSRRNRFFLWFCKRTGSGICRQRATRTHCHVGKPFCDRKDATIQPWTANHGRNSDSPFSFLSHPTSTRCQAGGGCLVCYTMSTSPVCRRLTLTFPRHLPNWFGKPLKGIMPTPRSNRAFTSIDSPVIAVGGLDDDGYPVARVESYDAASNRRTVLPANLHDCAVVPAKYSVVVMGGLSSHGDGQILNTDSRRWTKLPSRNEVRLGFAARSLLLARKHTVGGGGSRKRGTV